MKRIALLLLLLTLLTACAGTERIPPAPTATPTPAPTETPLPTPTETPKPTATPYVDVAQLFSAHPDFAQALIYQDPKAKQNFIEREGRYYLKVGDREVEIDVESAGVNVDIYGEALLVEGTGFRDPLTIHGAGESEGKVFAYNPETRYLLADGREKFIPGHWFEVIQPNARDENLTPREQIEYDINHPVPVTVEQVQNGDWAMSVLLSGKVKPFPKDWKFLGNSMNQYLNGNIDFLTSDKIPVNFFGVVEINGKKIGLRPWQVWNPEDLTGWNWKDFSGSDQLDHTQVMILTAGVGEENLTNEIANANYLSWTLDGIPIPGHSNEKLQARLIISAYDDWITKARGPILYQPSILVLKDLPENDPRTIDFINEEIIDHESKESWKIIYSFPMEKQLQNLIWLVYYH